MSESGKHMSCDTDVFPEKLRYCPGIEISFNCTVGGSNLTLCLFGQLLRCVIIPQAVIHCNLMSDITFKIIGLLNNGRL